MFFHTRFGWPSYNDNQLLLQHMGGQDLRYIKGIVVDDFVFEWIMNVITWYVYIIYLPGFYIIVVITFTRSMLSVDINQPV